jgi:uncharacterized membrane protein YfhO
VIADTYYPGWNAWIDDTPTKLFPTDLLFRGVYVPAGEHLVELRYQPASFLYGVLISSAAALCCLLIALRHWTRRA